jgi:hypothetical protein
MRSRLLRVRAPAPTGEGARDGIEDRSERVDSLDVEEMQRTLTVPQIAAVMTGVAQVIAAQKAKPHP